MINILNAINVNTENILNILSGIKSNSEAAADAASRADDTLDDARWPVMANLIVANLHNQLAIMLDLILHKIW
jgi:hypothetical protein